jgi:hypothetical protein
MARTPRTTDATIDRTPRTTIELANGTIEYPPDPPTAKTEPTSPPVVTMPAKATPRMLLAAALVPPSFTIHERPYFERVYEAFYAIAQEEQAKPT